MLNEFKNPPARFRMSPLWQWNTAPDPDEVERQIHEMHRKGIGGFTIIEHPEPKADSGEPAWEQCLERARSVAAELGMSAHVSDDACWFARTRDNTTEDERASLGIDQLVVGPVELPIGDASSGPGLMVLRDLQFPGVARVFGDKLGVSTAHCAGIGRTVSAPFASHRWPVSMEQMKAELDCAAALGINMFLPSAWPYGLVGTNDGELTASVFYQSALWPHFRCLADYAARLCYALSQGDHKAQIALLNPVNSFVHEQERNPLSPAARLAVDYFNVYCEWLLKEHLDYDIVCEESISSALAIDQRLAIGNEEYALLIMPPMTAISRGAADKIAEYVEDGGALLGNTLLPVFDTQDEHPEYVKRIFSDIFGLDPAFLRDHVMAGAQSPRPRLSHNYGNLAFYESPDAQDLIPGLRHTVAMVIKPEVSIRRSTGECPNIICQHRTIGDHDLFFFVNTAPVTREVKIALRCDKAPYVLDPETGSTMALPNCTQKGSRTVFTYTFRSHESLLVYFTDEIVLPAIPRATCEGYEIVLNGEWGFRTEGPNCFPLRDWVSTHQAGKRVLETSFTADAPPNELFLILPGLGRLGQAVGVSVNGAPAPSACGWLFDVTFAAIDIAALVRQGENHIALIYDEGGGPDWDKTMNVAMLAGSFSLDASWSKLQPPRVSIPTGSWTGNGYPFYSGTAVYSQTMDIPAFHQNQTVLVRTEDAPDVIEFIVNGACAGVRAWTPYESDITHLIKPGPNLIELRVTNTSANALGQEPIPSGLLSGARLIIC